MAAISVKTVRDKNGTPIRLRTPTAEDAQAVQDLANNVFQTSQYIIMTPEDFSSHTTEDQKKRIQASLDKPDSIIIVAESHGRLIGMLDFANGGRQRTKHQGTLGVSVHADFRFRGVGRMLMKSLIEWARNQKDLDVLYLTVAEKNHSAVQLYESLGFQKMGYDPYMVKLGPGIYEPTFHMYLKLFELR